MGQGHAGMPGFYPGQVPYPGGQGQPRIQGQGKQGQPQIPSQGEGHPRGPFQMPHMQGYPPFMPFGPMGPGQGFPVSTKPGEDAQKTQGQGEGQSQQGPLGYPFMNPWGFFDPRMFPGMFPQGQPHDTDHQPHSGPPPPYNGSTLAQPDRPLHDSQTAQKVLPDEPELSELKAPLIGPVGKGMLLTHHSVEKESCILLEKNLHFTWEKKMSHALKCFNSRKLVTVSLLIFSHCWIFRDHRT